jgi:hypothetical protein
MVVVTNSFLSVSELLAMMCPTRRSSGAPNSVAVWFPSRCAHRRPLSSVVRGVCRSKQFAFSCFAYAVPVQACAAANVAAPAAHRVLRASRGVQAFPLVWAFAPLRWGLIAGGCAVCVCASRRVSASFVAFPLLASAVRVQARASRLRFMPQVPVGVFALTGRSSGTRRNSCFESSREFVHHHGVARPPRRAP